MIIKTQNLLILSYPEKLSMRMKKLPPRNDINIARNYGDSQMNLWNDEDYDEALAVTRTTMTRAIVL